MQAVFSGTTVFTTGQIAKICNVAPRTVSKWFDSGQLKGYRIPGSKDRRVPREMLRRFIRENELVLPGFEDPYVLLLSSDSLLTEHVRRLCPQMPFIATASPVRLGILLSQLLVDVLIIDYSSWSNVQLLPPDLEDGVRPRKIVGIDDMTRLERVDERFTRPFDPELLMKRVSALLTSVA